LLYKKKALAPRRDEGLFFDKMHRVGAKSTVCQRLFIAATIFEDTLIYWRQPLFAVGAMPKHKTESGFLPSRSPDVPRNHSGLSHPEKLPYVQSLWQ
jgi:hypothetical protein